MELQSFGPLYKSKIKQKTLPTNLQWLFEVAFILPLISMGEFYYDLQ